LSPRHPTRDSTSLSCAAPQPGPAGFYSSRSMSSELASVRAEIKTWERGFRNTNGRNPTIDDIKQQPTVGASR